MSYLRKEYKKLIERMNKKLKLPKGWHYFVKKELEKQNVILKNKKSYKCYNCNHEFESNKKINEYEKCPKCRKTYLIKSSRGGHVFIKDLVLLDKFEGKWLIRLFEIFSRISSDGVYHSKPVEYGRILFQEEMLEFANDRLMCGMYGREFVSHSNSGKKWRRYNYYYRSLRAEGKVFYKNLKELFKDTEYKYSELWTLAKYEDKINLKYYLRNNFPSTELLVKMKLYKLALCPATFNINGTFEERFGVNKSYYQFMKKNNIDIDELHILKFYKKEDITAIRYLRNFYIGNLEKINKYMSLEKFVEYTKMRKKFDLSMYIDYLELAEQLQLDLNNKIHLFPDNLKQKHDECEKQIEIAKNKNIQKNIKKRYKELEKNSYNNKKYMIFPAKSVKELEDESKQQNHCVRTYAEKYANGKCDIYFMREIDKPKNSLVTIEVREDKIVQSRIKNNREPDRIQKNFLKKWETKVLNAA